MIWLFEQIITADIHSLDYDKQITDNIILSFFVHPGHYFN